MDKADVIRISMEVGLINEAGDSYISIEDMQRFANLVAAAEREACAEEIEKIFQQEASMDTMREYVKRKIPYEKAAAAIRARGQE